MNFIIYPLLFGLIFALFKTLDLWYSKKSIRHLQVIGDLILI
ncbi:hypothetical protein [Staphylococcus cohnii]|nr:hypothetical protein [Staphylococcus cohnii]